MSDPAARLNLLVPATLNFVSLLIEAHAVIARNFGFDETAVEDMAHCIGDVITLLAEGTSGFNPQADMSLGIDASGEAYCVRLECGRPPIDTEGNGRASGEGPVSAGTGGCQRSDGIWSKFGPAVTSTMARAFEAFEFTADRNGDPALILKRPLPKAR